MDTNHYTLMARYNQWMNENLLDWCDLIPDEQRKANTGAYFRSIHGTLNHILHVDLLWMGRFIGRSLTNAVIGEDICADYDELRAFRQQLDHDIIMWADQVSPDWLQLPFTYTSAADGKFRTLPAWVLVTQMFNHQTHHRGQLTTILNQMGIDHGVTDIPAMPAVQFVASPV
ncbi:MAG TPA: DinB family protein [Kiritimatiellia bacterium]|nr:DinB family protein [Kiritimatiellia bacterium]